MKKLTLTLLFALFMCLNFQAIAQNNQQDDRIVVSASDLPASVLEEIKKKKELENIEYKVQSYGKWAGMGEEIGTAVSGALTAVKDVSIEFADSDLGHFTMLMVAWKVMGIDVVRIVIGVFLIFLGWIFTLKSYFKTCTPTRLYENGRQPLFMRPFKSSGPYTIVNPMWNEGGGAFLHFVVMASFAGVGALIMFS